MNGQYLSFFSGALGLDLGLEMAGLIPLAVNEIDPIACRTIKRNRPGVRLYDRDIRALKIEALRHELQLQDVDLFAIVGGPPCQAFSTAGRRLGLNDERGNVFLYFIELVTALRPKYAVFENVRGLLSAPLLHRPHDKRAPGTPLTDKELPGGALLAILNRLESSGYVTTFTLYNTANYGVPQVRERLIFFASREGRGIPFIEPTHDEHGRNGMPKWRTFRDAIEGLDKNSHHFSRFPQKRAGYFKLLRPGENWRNLPEELHKEAMGKSFLANGGKTGFYRRLAWDKPAPTLVTRPNMPATTLCHPEELRPLSVQEYARIQTFPDEYCFEGKLDDQYRQIGNAVPPLFGQRIGEHLVSFDHGLLPDSIGHGRMSRYVGTDHASWRAGLRRSQQSLVF